MADINIKRRTNLGTFELLNPATSWAQISGKPSTFTPSAHTHSEGEITDLSIAWGDITDKPSTFTPSSHTHAQSEVTSLVTDLADRVQKSTTNLGKVGSVSLQSLSSAADWANLPIGKAVMVHSGSVGRPSWAAGYGYVIKGAARDTSGGGSWIWIDYYTGEIVGGKSGDSATLPTWYRQYNPDNIPSLATLGAAAASHGEHVVAVDIPRLANYLDTGVDLNSITAPGFYYQTSNANATGASNYPEAAAGSLLVQKSAGQVTQMYITYNDGDIYTRTYYTSWSAWRKVSFTDHDHGSLDQDGVLSGTATIGSGDALLVADASQSNKLYKTSLLFNTNQTEFLRSDGQWAAPAGGVSSGDIEWKYINLIETGSNIANVLINATNLGEAFDFRNYDYKFVCDISTNAEDNSIPYIRVDNDGTAARHAYVYNQYQVNTAATASHLFDGDATHTLISTGLALGTYSADGGGEPVTTQMYMEFTICRGYQGVIPLSSAYYPYIVEGFGSAHYHVGQQPTGWYSGSCMAKFSGIYTGGTSTSVDQILIAHAITAGTLDYSKIRVYKRAKNY